MAKFTNISFARILSVLLVIMLIAESLPTPTGKSAFIYFQCYNGVYFFISVID